MQEWVDMKYSRGNILVIGAAGKQAREYIQNIKSIYDSQFKFAGQDPNGRLIREDDFELGFFRDLNEALNSNSFNLAIVAVPHANHFEITKRLLASKIPIIKEKPFALNASEAKSLAALSDKGNAPIYTTAPRPWSELWRAIKRELQVLHPYLFRYDMTLALSRMTSGWRAIREKSRGGALLDMGYHAVDLLHYLLGDIDSIQCVRGFAYSEMKDRNLEDSVAGLIECQQFMNGSFSLHRHHSNKMEELEVLCREGVLKASNSTLSFYDRNGALQWKREYKNHLKKAELAMLRHFVELSLIRVPHYESCRRAFLVTKVLEGAIYSNSLKLPQSISAERHRQYESVM